MRIFKSENFIIFLIVFLIAACAGFYLNYHLKFIFGDALVRSFHAYLVFYGFEPKFSAIGFVWPPLQTLLQLPLVLIPQLNNSGFAGNIFTAIFLGISAIYLNLLGKFFKVNKLVRFTSLAFFITNPLIFFYGINGMSEIIGITFLLMTLYYFLKHIATKSAPALIVSSLTFACAIMTRWEIGILLMVLLPILFFLPNVNRKYSRKEVESSMVMFILPIIFVIGLWVVISWLITGSLFPGAEQVDNNLSDATGTIQTSLGTPMELFTMALTKIFLLSPLFIPLVISSISKLKGKLSLETFAIFGFALGMLFVHIVLFSLGKTVGELRYFMYVIPFTYVLLFLNLRNTVVFSINKGIRILFYPAFLGVLLTSSLFTLTVMSSQTFNNQEYIFIKSLVEGHNNSKYFNYENDETIAKYIAENINSRSVLVDDAVGFGVIYYTKRPSLFIQSIDSDFKQALDEPQKHAKYILVSNSGEDLLSKKHTGIFEQGLPYLTLEKDFGNWRLYKLKEGMALSVQPQ